jgi:CheY-like chemotaxis protein
MKNVKILVVEDITLNQMLMKTILDDLDLIVRLPKMVK